MRHDKHVADDELGGRNPEYDRLAKKILSYKKLLAAILHHVVSEFKTVSRKDIEEKYIIGTPEVGTVSIEPGRTNKSFRPPENAVPPQIRGAATEQGETAEGYVTFDILFYAKVPGTGDIIKLIINIEAQKAIPTDYPLMKRVIYYGCRLISSQKERDFTKSDYGKIKKIYTIWLCFEPPKGKGSGINKYTITEKHLYGSCKEDAENYALLNAVVLYIGNRNTGDKLLNMLRLIFKENLTTKEKTKKLKDEYDLSISGEMGEEMDTMCNLSEGIYERGIRYGERRGEKRGIALGEKRSIALGEKRGMALGEKSGADRAMKLVQILLSANRLEDVQHALNDDAYREKLFKEFKL